jgi:YidC/Oxa1 family membrane protein insertase
MDRNQAIGMILIFMILVAYFNFFAPEPVTETAKPTTEQTEIKESSLAEKFENDSIAKTQLGDFATAIKGESRLISVENNDLEVVFDTKGASLKSVKLKNYTTYSKEPLYLFSQNNTFDMVLPTKKGDININELYFSSNAPEKISISSDKQQIAFRVALAEGAYIEKTYTLAKEGFIIEHFVRIEGLDNEFSGKNAVINFSEKVAQVEKEIEQSRLNTTVNYFTTDGTFDYLSERGNEKKEATAQNLSWVALKKKFFINGLIAEKPFESAEMKSEVDLNSENMVKNLYATIQYPVENFKKGADFKLFFGPNQEDIIEEVTAGFENNLYLGWTIFGSINRWVIYPLFKFLQSNIASAGLLIFVLVFILKLILSPLTYTSYLSMAKMKVLKPEIDEIKARIGDDMQAQQAETMKLYQQVGVNPLSGCIPVLLQMPILLAMFNLFPNLIELRGQSFLWAEDLSTYDSFFNLPFTIPFYGDHVSMFTLLMTVSTLVYTWYNAQMNTSMTGPMMYMQYMMPVVFLFVMNSFPSGLSFYYFVSNIFTIGQQVLTKQFVDETKIREKLEKNKTTASTRKPNRFMQRMEEAMKETEKRKKK